jgi:hypothetical protein
MLTFRILYMVEDFIYPHTSLSYCKSINFRCIQFSQFLPTGQIRGYFFSRISYCAKANKNVLFFSVNQFISRRLKDNTMNGIHDTHIIPWNYVVNLNWSYSLNSVKVTPRCYLSCNKRKNRNRKDEKETSWHYWESRISLDWQHSFRVLYVYHECHSWCYL